MTGYRVNIAELARLINTLADGAQQVRKANEDLAAHGQLGMLGHEALAGSVHELEQAWRYGLGELAAAADNVIERLHSAKRNYQQLDEARAEVYDTTQPGTQSTGFASGYLTGIGPYQGGGIVNALDGHGS